MLMWKTSTTATGISAARKDMKKCRSATKCKGSDDKMKRTRFLTSSCPYQYVWFSGPWSWRWSLEQGRLYPQWRSLLITQTGRSGWCTRWLPKDVLSPALKIFKSHLCTALGNLLSVTLLSRGVGLHDLKRSLPTSTALCSFFS